MNEDLGLMMGEKAVAGGGFPAGMDTGVPHENADGLEVMIEDRTGSFLLGLDE